MVDLDEYYQYLIDMEIATEEELDLVTGISGYSEETLDAVLYYRSGYHDLEQYTEYEDREFYNEHFKDDDEEDDDEEDNEED